VGQPGSAVAERHNTAGTGDVVPTSRFLSLCQLWQMLPFPCAGRDGVNTAGWRHGEVDPLVWGLPLSPTAEVHVGRAQERQEVRPGGRAGRVTKPALGTGSRVLGKRAFLVVATRAQSETKLRELLTSPG